ncbi:hypothetical protein T459_34684 [Capsicum annuum]|uniref:Uncharacterized protein n=1 Tax=Capsicum annuum TaxID=4072 RepID=A0A2G2XVH3_CAPAN|nr:hypothetical protein T459_34684 [Capsicum annuum]
MSSENEDSLLTLIAEICNATAALELVSLNLWCNIRESTIAQIRHSTLKTDTETVTIGVLIRLTCPKFELIYKGRLMDGVVVAIRSIRMGKRQSIQSYTNQLGHISKIRYCHLVSTIGHWFECNQDDSSVSRICLVLEFVPNGKLGVISESNLDTYGDSHIILQGTTGVSSKMAVDLSPTEVLSTFFLTLPTSTRTSVATNTTLVEPKSVSISQQLSQSQNVHQFYQVEYTLRFHCPK